MIKPITREEFIKNIDKSHGFTHTYLNETPKIFNISGEYTIIFLGKYFYLEIPGLGYYVYVDSIKLLLQYNKNTKIITETEFNNHELSMEDWKLTFKSKEIPIDHTLNVFNRTSTFFGINQSFSIVDEGSWELKNVKTNEILNFSIKHSNIYRNNWYGCRIAHDKKLDIPINVEECERLENLVVFLLYELILRKK